MPLKRMQSYDSTSKEIKEIALQEIKKYQNSNTPSAPNCFILLILMTFLLCTYFEVQGQMNEKFTISEK